MDVIDAMKGADASHRARGGDVASLTGLRFLAAISVALAHGALLTLKYDPPSDYVQWASLSSAFGMTMFFVLSGFVIHYNYRQLVTAQGWAGLGAFLWARFARLYPLFLLILALDILLGRKLFDFMLGNVQTFAEVLRALPYYLLFVQSWVFIPFADNSLIYVVGPGSAMTWSISTEWFFYLAYPAVALLLMRARRPGVILCLIAIWSLAWSGLASSLDAHTPALNAWAVGHFGPAAGIASGEQDSFVRWLTYFSPYLRIGEFVLGCLTAQLYLQWRDKTPTAREQAIGRLLLVVGLISIPLIVFLTYSRDFGLPLLMRLRHNYGLAPSAALVLFCASRYDNGIARFLGSRPLVALGEASYSIYLIHFLVFFLVASSLGQALPATAPDTAFLLLRLIVLLALVCLISLGLHAFVEVPARRWLRGMWRFGGAWRPAFAASVAALPILAAVACVALASGIFPDRSEVTAGISLVSATYGGNCGAKSGNATRALRVACNGKESCDYIVDVDKLGDPAGGCAKDFSAEYSCMPDVSRRRTALPSEAGLRSHALLACAGAPSQAGAPAAKESATQTAALVAAPALIRPSAGIAVLSATYGGNCGARPGNVTQDLLAACNGAESCDYTVDVAKLGDPAGGCEKDYSAEYACMPGDSRHKAELPGEAGFGRHALLACARADLPASAPPAQKPAVRAADAALVAPASSSAAAIDIVSATYGGNCGAQIGNSTIDVQAACGGKARCTYSVDFNRLGDPVQGCRKDFVAIYKCAGKSDTRTRQAPAEAGFGAALELSCP